MLHYLIDGKLVNESRIPITKFVLTVYAAWAGFLYFKDFFNNLSLSKLQIISSSFSPLLKTNYSSKKQN